MAASKCGRFGTWAADIVPLDPCNAARQLAFDGLHRRSYGRILPGLIRKTGDLGRAEDLLQHAFQRAWETWPEDDWPRRPEAWLVRVAQHAWTDWRRRLESQQALPLEGLEVGARAMERVGEAMVSMDEDYWDEEDALRLIFTCCHPALGHDAQVALTLNVLCGLRAHEIGSLFLVSTSNMAQRLVRAKAKIRQAGIPFRLPPSLWVPERVPPVLRVLYLVFTTGHSAPSGRSLLRGDLVDEAIRLTRIMQLKFPGEQELQGLLALMLFQHARHAARIDEHGDLVLLEDQDRSLWDQLLFKEAHKRLLAGLQLGVPGSYCLQAAIAGVHAHAECFEETDWEEIVGLYDHLLAVEPSPVMALNRAVALAFARGPELGLAALECLDSDGQLANYSYLHSTRAELCARLGQVEQARAAWQRALKLTHSVPEQNFLRCKLGELDAAQGNPGKTEDQ